MVVARGLCALLLLGGCGSPNAAGAPEAEHRHGGDGTPEESTEAPSDVAEEEDLEGPEGEPPGAPLLYGPGAFTRVSGELSSDHGTARFSSPPGGACMVDLEWWRPRATRPGPPMEVIDRRTTTIAGREGSIVHATMGGGPMHAAFVNGEHYQARFRFESCGPVEVDDFLRGVREP